MLSRMKTKTIREVLGYSGYERIVPASKAELEECLVNFPYLFSRKGIHKSQPTKVDIYGVTRFRGGEKPEITMITILVRINNTGDSDGETTVYQTYVTGEDKRFLYSDNIGYVKIIGEEELDYITYNVLCDHVNNKITLTDGSGTLTKACR